jgi:hypothetical protein
LKKSLPVKLGGRSGRRRLMCENCLRLQNLAIAKNGPARRVRDNFENWKRLNLPDNSAFYHTALDIKYRRGGITEKIALLRLRQQRYFSKGQ